MRKKINYLALIAVLFVSCEEYYNPDMDVVSGLLVVESHLTNDTKQNFVKLSMTRDFYSTNEKEKVTGANVELVEVGGQSTNGVESSTGNFTFPGTPVPGKKYLLRITYQQNVFESEAVVMPPVPSIDTLYTKHHIEKTYRTDSYGALVSVETPGREIYIDAPISTELKYYRFSWTAILQWVYYPPIVLDSIPPYTPPSWYGWVKKYDKGSFNLAGPKEFSVSDKVLNHPILSLAYDSQLYLDSVPQIPAGWIVILDQYGITKDSYDFHEKLNKQFSAEGSLFDPVLTQVYGNIHCTNDPSKIVLGFFDLNSYRQYRYFMILGSGDDKLVHQRRLNRYIDIPNSGYEIET